MSLSAPPRRPFTPLHCVGLALAITVLHFSILFCWATPLELNVADSYRRFVFHDSHWFRRIINHGYHTTIPPSAHKNLYSSNVAFFPGYPLFGAILKHGLGVPTWIALLLAAHLATWGFWTYFLLFLRRWRLSAWGIAFAVMLVAVHPAAFFFIAAYSESLFLALLLGYLFWSGHPGRHAPALAVVHGIGATATRIAGVPAALYPVVQCLVARWRARAAAPAARTTRGRAAPARSSVRRSAAALGFRARMPGDLRWGALGDAWHALREPLGMSVLALGGAIAFFAYCQFSFGFWDLYMWTQEEGWGVHADYLALFKPYTYAQLWPDWTEPVRLGRFATAWTVFLFIAMIVAEVRLARRHATRWRERAGLYFVGFVLFFIAVSGVYSVRLESMIRYQLCTHVFLVLAAIHASHELGPRLPARRVLVPALLLLAFVSFLIQLHYAGIFLRRGWVA